ncbi:hypothetical protein D3C87_1584880 [compost metagenome]
MVVIDFAIWFITPGLPEMRHFFFRLMDKNGIMCYTLRCKIMMVIGFSSASCIKGQEIVFIYNEAQFVVMLMIGIFRTKSKTCIGVVFSFS